MTTQQLRHTRRIQELALSKLNFAAEIIRLGRMGHSQSALAIVRRGDGKRIMDAVRAVTEDMGARERTRLREREQLAAVGEKRAWVAYGTALGMGVYGDRGDMDRRRDALRPGRQSSWTGAAFRALADQPEISSHFGVDVG